MPLKKPTTLKTLLLISSLTWALCSCSTLNIPNPPDVPLCANHGSYAHCHTMVSNKSFTVDDKHPLPGTKDSYATTVYKSILMPATSFAQIKAWIENVCHRVSCKNGVGSWDKVVQDLDSDKD